VEAGKPRASAKARAAKAPAKARRTDTGTTGRGAGKAPAASGSPPRRDPAPATVREQIAAGRWRPGLGGVAEQLIGIVGAAADMSLGLGKVLGGGTGRRRTFGRAGALLRGAREAAGLTVSEVSAAIDLGDPHLLDLAERGKAALPVEVLLRLAAVLARNDPIPFLMQVARNYSPPLWHALEQLGIGRLVLHAGREHEFINVYRSRDAARSLSDDEFARVLAFTDAAFDMALTLAVDARRGSGAGRARHDRRKE